MSGIKNSIDIFLGQDKIAELQIKDDQLSWQYTGFWQEHGFAVSPHLPLQHNIPSINTQIFLRNMLPEGIAFEELVAYFHVSKNNTFALMRILGADTSCGLVLLGSGVMLPNKGVFREISINELQQRLDNREHFNLLIWDDKPRLSLAGVQDKLNVVYLGNKLGFGEGKLCSTHILKFERHKLAHLVLNEYVTMHLARKCGLDVADVDILHFGNHPSLLVKRFDRAFKTESEVQRRHVLDGCQMLNLPPEYKYERNFGSGRDVAHIREGVSYEKIFKLAEQCINPALTKQKMLDWALFNLLVYNCDAHGKNISFFVDKSDISLAPFYDLVNIKMYEYFNQEMAMCFGSEFDCDAINSYQLIEFADICGIPNFLLANRLNIIASSILDNINTIINSVFNNISLEDQSYLNRYLDLVIRRCNYFLTKITDIKTLSV